MGKTVEDRFWDKVNKKGFDDCWEWTACRAGGRNKRYGYFNYHGRHEYAHRISYCWSNALSLIDIKDKVVRHTCDNHRCVNPKHLLLGTQKDNVKDSVERGTLTFGEVNGQAVLTEMAIRVIRRLKGLLTQKEISEIWGITKGHVGLIQNRKRWKHV